MKWTVRLNNKAVKQPSKLSEKVNLITQLLIEDLKYNGPRPSQRWPNYGKLHGKSSEDKRHCHLIKGRPTYVCCWAVVDKKMKMIEVYYVGTHEKAPY